VPHIFLTSADGSDETRFLDILAAQPNWSPDGVVLSRFLGFLRILSELSRNILGIGCFAQGRRPGTSPIGERMKTRRASIKPLRLRELREERGFSQHSLAEESGVGRSTIAALEAGERGAQPNTVRALARALGVSVPDLYGTRITTLPRQERSTQTARTYSRLRENLRDAFPGIENEAQLERMAEQFVVELGWLQRSIFPHSFTYPRSTLSAHDLLNLADDFYRFRTEQWTWPMGDPGNASEVLPGGEGKGFGEPFN
jgi:transcriptional regulator with XRE-family HTH domain